jgi:hypothetical protein
VHGFLDRLRDLGEGRDQLREIEGVVGGVRGDTLIGDNEVVLLDLWGKLRQPGAVYADITWIGFTGPKVPERIAKAVSDYYSVPMDALQGQKRDKAIVVPRQIAMFLMREETDVSLLRIGAELGHLPLDFRAMWAISNVFRSSTALRRHLEALHLFERKGNAVSARKARAVLSAFDVPR